MFLSTLNDFIKVREKNVYLHCEDTRIHSLLKRSFQKVTIQSTKKDLDSSKFGQKILLEDVAHFTRGEISNFFPKKQFLYPCSQLKAATKKKLEELPYKVNVGIAWKGGSVGESTSLANTKSANLSDFKNLMDIDSVNFINLQYGDCENEINALYNTEGLTLHNFDDIDPLQDIESQLALISNLDLVIQTSNASLHFAGSVGTPSWALIGSPPDWRWFTEEHNDESPWYPNMVVYQKPLKQTWQEFIGSLRGKLTAFLANQ
jgi:ADP-heptose:LPS heptosyltransferase